MNFLTIEDLLEASMFKCKICERRLQLPVIQVGKYGNICGVCYERSAFTDAASNEDVKMILSKLHVSCNYKDRGCWFDASYSSTCKHENSCEFRDKICPFAYVGLCDNTPKFYENMPDHIFNCHANYILTCNAYDSVCVPNPNVTNRDIFYLVLVDNKQLLLRTWLDSGSLKIYYAFYYFKKDLFRVSFDITYDDVDVKITKRDVVIQEESEIKQERNIGTAIGISVATLRCLNCLDYVDVHISTRKNQFMLDSPVFRRESVCIRCSRCSKIETSLNSCRNCNTWACAACSSLTTIYCRGGEPHSWALRNLHEWGLMYLIQCQNAGCLEIFKFDEYYGHMEICPFRQYACPLQNEILCRWVGAAEDMPAHVTDAHRSLVNQEVCTVETSKFIFFIKGDQLFTQRLALSSDGDLSVKTDKITAPDWDKTYKWEIRMKNEQERMMTVITDFCCGEHREKTVNVRSYVRNNELTLYTYILCNNEQNLLL